MDGSIVPGVIPSLNICPPIFAEGERTTHIAEMKSCDNLPANNAPNTESRPKRANHKSVETWSSR